MRELNGEGVIQPAGEGKRGGEKEINGRVMLAQ
jgi:hypothetical protein